MWIYLSMTYTYVYVTACGSGSGVPRMQQMGLYVPLRTFKGCLLPEAISPVSIDLHENCFRSELPAQYPLGQLTTVFPTLVIALPFLQLRHRFGLHASNERHRVKSLLPIKCWCVLRVFQTHLLLYSSYIILPLELFEIFYRAKRSVARYCHDKLSVCPSDRPSLCR